MSIDINTLFSTYDATHNLVATHNLMVDEFQPVNKAFEDKRANPSNKIIVYGVYNAGKSTLINALVGKEIAQVADIPCTDAVNKYQWGRFELLDTPGVDAPTEHQQITEAELNKADAVIFVVNPVGAAAEEQTLEALVRLLKERKKVLLVCNERDDLSSTDFAFISEKIRIELQKIAQTQQLSGVLKDIPIFRVNARRAYNAKKVNNAQLLEKSYFPTFEKELTEFLDSLKLDEAYVRLQQMLLDFLRNLDQHLAQQSKDEILKQYDQLLRDFEQDKGNASSILLKEIDFARKDIQTQIRVLLQNNIEQQDKADLENKIQQIFQQKQHRISTTLEQELSALIRKQEDYLGSLHQLITGLNQQEVMDSSIIDIPKISVKDFSENLPVEVNTGISKDQIDMITKGATEMIHYIKPEHIVTTMQTIKDIVPSIMKGIGIKTMEKYANVIMNKLPYVGPVIQGVFAVYDMVRDDPEVTQLNRQIAEQQRQQERIDAQIEDAARNIAIQFENAITSQMDMKMKEIFEQISQKILDLRNPLGEQEKLNSELIEQVAILIQQVQ